MDSAVRMADGNAGEVGAEALKGPKAAELSVILPSFNEAANIPILIGLLDEALAGIAPTAHILGGAILAPDPQRGVVDGYGEVFGYPGLSVTDASIMPCNVGVNPALSITALAEHCLSSIPEAA